MELSKLIEISKQVFEISDVSELGAAIFEKLNDESVFQKWVDSVTDMSTDNLQPIFQLGMRLGEGSGCPLAFQVLDAACAVINHMATFDEAGINDDYLEEIRQGDHFTP